MRGLYAAAAAALQPLPDAIGRSWLFTLIGFVGGGIGLLATRALRRWGCNAISISGQTGIDLLLSRWTHK